MITAFLLNITSFLTFLMANASLENIDLLTPVLKEPNLSVETPVNNNLQPVGNVLRAGVSVTKDLPSGFYGRWAVRGRILETNNPYRFKTRSSDIWILQKNDGIITLSNPATGASASITVTEVRGNTAKFTRVEDTENRYEKEVPVLTISESGDSFYGTNTLIVEKYLYGKRVKKDVVKYRLVGRKISGPPIKDIFSSY